VRYGDHQPEFSPHILDPPRSTRPASARKLENYDPRYYATYYAIDAINFEPVKSPAVMDTIDGPYLPLVIQEAAGIPRSIPRSRSRKASCFAARVCSTPAGTARKPRRFKPASDRCRAGARSVGWRILRSAGPVNRGADTLPQARDMA